MLGRLMREHSGGDAAACLVKLFLPFVWQEQLIGLEDERIK